MWTTTPLAKLPSAASSASMRRGNCREKTSNAPGRAHPDGCGAESEDGKDVNANTPDRSTAAAFPRYLTGEVVADSVALQWPELYARRWRLPRVVDRFLV